MKKNILILIIIFISILNSYGALQKKGLKLKNIDEYAKSKRWAIVIGINNYEDKFIQSLEKARNDAKAISDALQNEGQFDYVYTFTDDNDKEDKLYPSLNKIKTKLEFLKSEIKPDDTLVFCFSGHGISDDNGKSYLLVADSNIASPFTTTLALADIEKWISEIGVKKNIVMLDACRNVLEKTKGVNKKTLMEEMNSQAEVSAVFYATSPGEYSYEHDKEPYGVFTTFLLNGLKGQADANYDGLVTFNEVRTFVEGGVKEWGLANDKKQKPYTSIKGEFHGEVAMSAVPEIIRKPFNPNLITSNFTKQMIMFRIINYTSLSFMIATLVGAGIGGVVAGVGYSQYANLNADSVQKDWELYSNMQEAGFVSLIVFSSLAVTSLIPFIVSFAVKPKDKSKSVLNFDLNYYDNKVYCGFKLKL